MAIVNAPLERAVVSMLRPEAHERALEIGFGPGVGIALLARRLPDGWVCGVDPSDVMLQQATWLNRRAIRRGHVGLVSGQADALPWDDGSFDAVCSVNNVQLWEPLDRCVAEVRRVLRPGGRLVIGVRDWWWRNPDARRAFVGEIERALERGGLTDVSTRRTRAAYGPCLYFGVQA
jgi:SAM-dependent methyltransferase